MLQTDTERHVQAQMWMRSSVLTTCEAVTQHSKGLLESVSTVILNPIPYLEICNLARTCGKESM